MKSILKPIWGVMLVLSLATACKDKKEEPTPKTPNELMAQKKWKLTSGTMKVSMFGQNLSFDMMDEMEPCEKDNTEKYELNGTFVNDEGATKCDANDPQTADSGTWSLAENNTKLIRTNTEGTQTFDIITLDETTLKIKTAYSGDFALDPTKPNETITLSGTVEMVLNNQ